MTKRIFCNILQIFMTVVIRFIKNYQETASEKTSKKHKTQGRYVYLHVTSQEMQPIAGHPSHRQNDESFFVYFTQNVHNIALN